MDQDPSQGSNGKTRKQIERWIDHGNKYKSRATSEENKNPTRQEEIKELTNVDIVHTIVADGNYNTIVFNPADAFFMMLMMAKAVLISQYKPTVTPRV